MMIPATIKWRYVWEALFILLIAMLVWKGGASHLAGWHGPAGSLTNELFIPAIMMNAGHDFNNVDPANIPGLGSFLDFQTPTFDTTLIPDDIKVVPLHPYQEFHRYLIYSVALAWWFNGITWDAVKLLILIYFFLTCLAVYGICRLAMNPVLSILVVITFVYSPAVSLTLPILRDFAKAPFILSIIFLLGIIIFRPLRHRHFILCALLIGVLLGIGMGIRRDMMVFLPISVALLFFGVIKSSRYAWLIRFSAVALLIASFILAGWPVHKSFMREGYLTAHDTIMGFSSFSDHELGLLKAGSYEKHYLLNDMYSTIKAHYAAGLGVTFPKSVYQERAAEPDFDFEVKRAYVKAIALTFPADMLARAYAAVMRITVGIIKTPFGIEKYGLWFTCIALLLIASRHPLRAWLLLAMLCYFCGYTSIQFAVRHAFHTSFVPFFFLGFLLHHSGLYIWKKLKSKKQATVEKEPEKEPIWLLCGRATVWALLTVFIFCVPLLAARQVQHNNVEALRLVYEAAPLTPVDYAILKWDGRPLVAPTEAIRADGFEGQCLLADFDTGVVVALFDDVNMPLDLRAVYEWEDGIGDFGGPLTSAVRNNNQKCPAKFYFPIHEKTAYGADWSRFAGLSMSEQAISSFRGLYRVKDLSDFGLLVNMLLPDNNKRFLYCQDLSFPWKGAPWTPYAIGSDFDPVTQTMKIQECLQGNNLSQAIELTTNALKQHPGSILFTILLADAQELSGDAQSALNSCLNLLKIFPNIPAVYAQLDRYFDKHGGAQRRVDSWSAILARVPTLAPVKKYLALATSDMNAEADVDLKD